MDNSQSHTTLSTIPKLIFQVLEVEGIDAQNVFEHAGLAPNTLEEQSARVPMKDMSRLWEASANASHNPGFGLLAASLFQPAYLKGIGFAWMASDTIGDGLASLIKNISMINTAVKLELVHEGSQAIIKYSPIDSFETTKTPVHPCAIQLGLGFFLRMFRIATGRPIPVSSVYLKHAIDDDLRKKYVEFFDCEIRDGALFNGIEFEQTILNERLPTADTELATMNDQLVEKYLKSLQQPEIIKKVEQCVTPLLPSGCPTEAEIAVRLHMSRRTLQRKLQAVESSFGKVLAQLRNNIAKSLLNSEGLPITTIAYQIGYGSPSAFSRSFRKENGLTPNEYREQALR